MTDTPQRIYLIGLMGAGKSTVGRRLAARTGWPYVDNDVLIEAATGRRAPEIVEEGGVDALHRAELRAFEHASRLPAPVIVGVAAFVVTDPPSRRVMRDTGTVVWLRARAETLHQRVGTGTGRRPAATSLAWVRSVVAEREPVFEELAHITIRVDRMRPAAVADAILAALDQAESESSPTRS